MDRASKRAKRKLRAARRKEKRNREYAQFVARYDRLIGLGGFSAAKGRAWPDNSSPTGYTQVCSYEAYGTCQAPCNGDC